MRLIPAKRLGRVAAMVGLLVVALVVASVPLFVVPATNAPAHVDAIVVLGGTGLGPVRTGERLAADGYAPNLVFSLVPKEQCLPSVVHLSVRASVQVSCFRADPQSTQGEARAIARLAIADRWHRILVVSTTAQITRARLRVTRCYSGQVLMVGVSDGGWLTWVHDIAYEWGALAKALVLQRGC